MTEYAVGLIVSTFIFVAWAFWFTKRPGDRKTTQIESEEVIKSEMNSDKKLKNVFSVKQKPLISSNGKHSTKAGNDRPFESSYYFAHNKHSTGGGYKDGLRAEDYEMNGPRLLSKGGVRVCFEKTCSGEDETNSEDKSCASSHDVSESRQKPTKLQASTPITRYLWDDGVGNIAKIIIDSLPVSSTKSINWADASVSNVDARLIGHNNEGLFIDITYNIHDEAKKCHLHVARMYGRAEEVKTMIKKHKLLIKITKKPKFLSGHHSNIVGLWGKIIGAREEAKAVPVAWPTLTSSSMGIEIDEELFKQTS